MSLGELGQADRLTDRIFAPNGLPDLQSSGWLDIEEDTSELPTGDHALERGEQDAIKAGIACSESVHAVIRHGLLLQTPDNAEWPVDTLRRQLELVHERCSMAPVGRRRRCAAPPDSL